MKKKLKPMKTPNPHARKIVQTVRLNPQEMTEVLNRAQYYTGGNVSEFIRHAILKFEPGKKDFQK